MAIKYSKTLAPGAKQVSTANQVIDFALSEGKTFRNCRVQFLQVQTFAQDCRIKINDESAIHWIQADSEVIFKDIDIDKITIVDAGVEYYYTAMTVE